MTSRREMLWTCGLLASLPGRYVKQRFVELLDDVGLDLVTEDQKGDLIDVNEYVTFSPASIRKLSVKSGKALFEPWKPLSSALISTARQFIGQNRRENPAQIGEFLQTFKLPLRTEQGDVPYCAAGLSYCALIAYSSALSQSYNETNKLERLRALMPDLEHYYFYPTVSCVDMYHIAAGKRRWTSYKAHSGLVPKAGWIVLFDWLQTGTPDHCGVVQSASKEEMRTIEFNTSLGSGNQRNGGLVAEKKRPYDYVLGFIITDLKP